MIANAAAPVAVTKFTVSSEELSDMMRMRGRQAARHIVSTYGGSAGLCARLWVSPQQGLSASDGDDIQQRTQVYGRNVIPPKMPKPYWELVLEAVGDTTLIILLLAALISLVMSMVSIYGIAPERHFSLPALKEANVEWIEAVAIVATVLLVVNVTAFNDWSKERQFRSLQGKIESNHKLSVIRDGATGEIVTSDILVGDILQVKYGDLLPADGIVIQSNDLKIDESSLTGETDLINKSAEKDPILLSGTHVMEGSGKMVVTAVGLNSQAGIIFKLLGATAAEKAAVKPTAPQQPEIKAEEASSSAAGAANTTKPKTSPIVVPPVAAAAAPDEDEEEGDALGGKSILQAKLTKMALRIGLFGTIAACITGIVLFLEFSIKQYGLKKQPGRAEDVSKFIHYFIVAITVIVVAVPEGLPLAVTLSLAFSVKKMMKDNNLVRHLDACETMGNATAICSDKTGTLTTNRMTTVQLFACSQYFRKIPNATMLPPPYVALLNNSIAVNTAYTSRIIPAETPGQIPMQAGNKTECALLGLIVALGDDYNLIRAMNPETSFVKIFTFHSGRKAMATLTRCGPNRIRVHVKGASERIVQWCTHVIDKEGQPRHFDANDGEHLIKNVIEPMASEGLRTLTMAYKDVIVATAAGGGGQTNERMPNDDMIGPGETSFTNVDHEGRQTTCANWFDSEQRVFSKLTLLSVAGIEDPVRPEVPDAIRRCQDAGITVRMVTGDNINTARSIAYKCGILSGLDSNNELILEGPDFNKRVRDDNGRIRQHLIDAIWPNLRVLARSSPQDKYTLVKGIIDSRVNPMREVVAVTGDGTNDGPALKMADVGFAMGIAGTDVAKEASDIILTDDNFSSIVKAVVWGRNIYDSIAKFLQFQLTVNIVAVIVVMLSAFIWTDTPLKAVQMLWVNLIMDTFGSLALATEPPTDALLKRKPYGRSKALISRTMLKSIIGQSVYQLAVIFFLMLAGPSLFDFANQNNVDTRGEPGKHYTMVFNTFVVMTLCNQLNARRIHNERNVLSGIQNNPIYIGIIVAELVAQVLLVTFGSIAFQTHPLTIDLWFWCLAIGASSLLWHQLLATIPTSIIPTSFTLGATVPENDENVEQILGYSVGPESQPRASVSNMALAADGLPLNSTNPTATTEGVQPGPSGGVGAPPPEQPKGFQQHGAASLGKSTRKSHNTDSHHHHASHHTNHPAGGSISSAVASIPIIGSLVHSAGQLRNKGRIHEQVHEMVNIQENLTRRMSPPLANRRHVSDTEVQDSLLSTAAGRHSRPELNSDAANLDVVDDREAIDQQTAGGGRSEKKPGLTASASAMRVNEVSQQRRGGPSPAAAQPLAKTSSQQAISATGVAISSIAGAHRSPMPDNKQNPSPNSQQKHVALPPADGGRIAGVSNTQNQQREVLPPLNPYMKDIKAQEGAPESGQGSARMSPRTMAKNTPSPGALLPSNMSSLTGVGGGRALRDDDELVFSTVEEANSMRSAGGKPPPSPNWSQA